MAQTTSCSQECAAIRMRQRSGDLSRLVLLRSNYMEAHLNGKLAAIIYEAQGDERYIWPRFAQIATSELASTLAKIVLDTIVDLLSQLCQCDQS